MIIYKTTNLINGKIYIGKYKGKNKNYLGSGTLFKKALEKYGKENFSREVIEDDIVDDKYLCEREVYWIAFYNSTNLDIGYNLTIGGNGVIDLTGEIGKKISLGRTGVRLSEESKKILSLAHMGIRQTEETKNKISISSSGSCNHYYGKTLSEDHKRKISENHADLNGENHPLWGKKPQRKNSSNFLGVCWCNTYKKWLSYIYFDHKKLHLGYFIYEVEAALAYNEMAFEIFGWKAQKRINIISKKEIDQLWEEQ